MYTYHEILIDKKWKEACDANDQEWKDQIVRRANYDWQNEMVGFARHMIRPSHEAISWFKLKGISENQWKSFDDQPDWQFQRAPQETSIRRYTTEQLDQIYRDIDQNPRMQLCCLYYARHSVDARQETCKNPNACHYQHNTDLPWAFHDIREHARKAFEKQKGEYDSTKGKSQGKKGRDKDKDKNKNKDKDKRKGDSTKDNFKNKGEGTSGGSKSSKGKGEAKRKSEFDEPPAQRPRTENLDETRRWSPPSQWDPNWQSADWSTGTWSETVQTRTDEAYEAWNSPTTSDPRPGRGGTPRTGNWEDVIEDAGN